MSENRKTNLCIAGAFLLLCAVSLYRKLSIAYLPGDQARPFVVYSVYMLLMGGWLYSLQSRITQKSMTMYLRLECYVMMFWLTVRMFQEAFLYENVHSMRITGYFIGFPLLLSTLFGMYAAFGLSRGEQYRISKKWYLLLIPDLMLLLLMLTNEYHHFVFRILPGEGENLYFHANVGIILILILATMQIVFRMLIIYQRTHQIKGKRRIKLLPLLIGIGMPLEVLPYFVNGFVARHELIELTAKLYFLEVMSWECCILLGLVPVNTQYRMVFKRSTAGMRIIDDNGETIIKSDRAKSFDHELFLRLKEEKMVADESGTEMYLYPLHSGSLVYQKDVSALYSTISELKTITKELEEEGTLIQRELRTRSEEAAVVAQNQIYDRLSSEVGSQLSLMEELIDEADDDSRESVLKKLTLIGTYVKRRCNLRLIEQENGTIDMNELYLSLNDIVRCLSLTGVSAELIWEPSAAYTSEYCIRVFDSVEEEIEKAAFRLSSMVIRIGEKAEIHICGEGGEVAHEV